MVANKRLKYGIGLRFRRDLPFPRERLGRLRNGPSGVGLGDRGVGSTSGGYREILKKSVMQAMHSHRKCFSVLQALLMHGYKATQQLFLRGRKGHVLRKRQ